MLSPDKTYQCCEPLTRLRARAYWNRLVFFAERGTWNETLQRYVRPQEVYFDASDNPIPSPFPDIPRSFWWCMVTLMTVRETTEKPAGLAPFLPLSLAQVLQALNRPTLIDQQFGPSVRWRR